MARLDALRAEATDRSDVDQGEGRPPGGWSTVSARDAAEHLAERGADPAAARAMVADYLRETSEQVGTSVDEWGLDQGDIDAVAAAHQLPAAAACVAAEHDAADARAAQLIQWHADDHPVTDADGAMTDVGDATADGVADDAGWPS